MKGKLVDEIASIGGVNWCALSTSEGFIEEVSGAPAKFLENSASIIPSVIESAGALLENVNLSEPRFVTITGDEGVLIITFLNHSFSLLTHCSESANMGLVRREVKRASGNLLPLLEHSS